MLLLLFSSSSRVESRQEKQEASQHVAVPAKDLFERVKMMPAASGAPGTRVSFGKWTRRAWMGAGYLVARTLDADGVNSHLVDRFGEEG